MAKQFDLSVIFRVIDKASRPIRTIGKSLTRLATGPVRKANAAFKQLGKTVRKVGKSMSEIGKSMALKLTAPILLLGGLAARSAIKFESAFTGVKKTVEITAESIASLRKELGDKTLDKVKAVEILFARLRKELEKMALKIPLTTEEIFGIAEAAGQLGIKQEDILEFTKVMADLGATTNMSANEAATALARFANITGLSSKNFDRLGATIVDLGNNLATTEGEIVDMTLRLAAAGKLIGLTEDQTLSLAGALSSVGVRAEAGGTAFSQVMRRIAKEIGTGSEKMQGFAAVAGMSIGKFEKLWKENAAEALLQFVEGLGKVEKKGINVNQVLDVLGFEGIRISDSLLRAAGAGDKFRSALELGSKAWKENTALTIEANLRYGTAESQLILAKNRAVQMAVAFGKVLVPAILKVTEKLIPLIEFLTNLSPRTKAIILVVAGLVAAIGPLLIVLGGLTIAVGAVTTALASMATIFGINMAALTLLLAPIAAVAAALVGLGALAFSVWKNWKDLKQIFTNFWDDPLKELKAWGTAIKFWFNDLVSILTKIGDLMLAPFIKVADFIANKLPKFVRVKLGIEDETKEPIKPELETKGAKSLLESTKTKEIIKAPAESTSSIQERMAANLARIQVGQIAKSETDINIKVTSEAGTSATVEKVRKKTGDANVNVATTGFVGAF